MGHLVQPPCRKLCPARPSRLWSLMLLSGAVPTALRRLHPHPATRTSHSPQGSPPALLTSCPTPCSFLGQTKELLGGFLPGFGCLSPRARVQRRRVASPSPPPPPHAAACLTNEVADSAEATESQHGRGWQGPLWVTQSNPLPKQGHPEQAAQHRVQTGLEYLQRRRLHSLPGQPGPGLRHPQRADVPPHLQLEPPLLQLVPADAFGARRASRRDRHQPSTHHGASSSLAVGRHHCHADSTAAAGRPCCRPRR